MSGSEKKLIDLTTQIVSAHVSHNAISAAELPKLIRDVYSTLGTVEAEVAKSHEMPEPAVPIRKSVMTSHIICLECGHELSMLKRHLSAEHGLTVDAYRAKWELPSNYPMVAPAYAKRRSELAKQIGLGTLAVSHR